VRLFGPIEGALIALAALLAARLPAVAETASEKADALLSGLIQTNDPGLAILVAQDGKILFEKGHGLAGLEHRVPITPQTIFRIGSITKQFTAAAILKLQEEGKLSVEDKLSKYIPGFPRGDEVTLRQLLTHTSGLGDYLHDSNIQSRVTNATTTEVIIKEIEKHPYDLAPGTKWHYSNSGYVLLGYIVEKVSGQSYGDFLRENFFQPLGMTNAGVYHSHLGLSHEALGYILGTNGFMRALNEDGSWTGGCGALYSTVDDLNRWNEGVFNGRVLDAASFKEAFTLVKEFESQTNSDSGYGFGWAVEHDRGLQVIGHLGGLPGFRSCLLRVPDEKFTVAVLSNVRSWTNDDLHDLEHQLANIYLADKFTPLPIANTNVPPESYDALTGRYELRGKILTISRHGVHLFRQWDDQPEKEIFPESPTEFFQKGGGTSITFVKDSSGKVAKLIYHNHDYGFDFVAPRVKETAEPPNPAREPTSTTP
jgi:CubicO group peptidase (beta-lactamase class C family)